MRFLFFTTKIISIMSSRSSSSNSSRFSSSGGSSNGILAILQETEELTTDVDKLSRFRSDCTKVGLRWEEYIRINSEELKSIKSSDHGRNVIFQSFLLIHLELVILFYIIHNNSFVHNSSICLPFVFLHMHNVFLCHSTHYVET